MTKMKKIVIPDDNVIEDIYEVFGNKYPLADYLRDLYELSWQNSRKINEIVDRVNDQLYSKKTKLKELINGKRKHN